LDVSSVKRESWVGQGQTPISTTKKPEAHKEERKTRIFLHGSGATKGGSRTAEGKSATREAGVPSTDTSGRS
jgi:hypothetical protein